MSPLAPAKRKGEETNQDKQSPPAKAFKAKFWPNAGARRARESEAASGAAAAPKAKAAKTIGKPGANSALIEILLPTGANAQEPAAAAAAAPSAPAALGAPPLQTGTNTQQPAAAAAAAPSAPALPLARRPQS